MCWYGQLFLCMYTHMLKDQSLQMWRTRCIENRKLSLYVNSALDVAKLRKCFESFILLKLVDIMGYREKNAFVHTVIVILRMNFILCLFVLCILI